MSAAPITAQPPVMGGLSSAANSCLYELRDAMARAGRGLDGPSTAVGLETARCELARVIETAEALRRHLPDAHGLRGGQAVHRTVRALAVVHELRRDLVSPQLLAGMIEVGVSAAHSLLLRAVIKGWAVQVEAPAGGHRDGRWGLTLEGRRVAWRMGVLTEDPDAA